MISSILLPMQTCSLWKHQNKEYKRNKETPHGKHAQTLSWMLRFAAHLWAAKSQFSLSSKKRKTTMLVSSLLLPMRACIFYFFKKWKATKLVSSLLILMQACILWKQQTENADETKKAPRERGGDPIVVVWWVFTNLGGSIFCVKGMVSESPSTRSFNLFLSFKLFGSWAVEELSSWGGSWRVVDYLK